MDGITQPVAILMSTQGPLHIFSASVVMSIINGPPAIIETLVPGSGTSTGLALSTCSTNTKTSNSDTLDGFTIVEWAAYARRKAKIASTMCKANGCLKAKLQELNASRADKCFAHDAARDHGTEVVEDSNDMLQSADPWLNATSAKPVLVEQKPDAWSLWTPTNWAPVVDNGFPEECSYERNSISPVVTGRHCEDPNPVLDRWAAVVSHQRKVHRQIVTGSRGGDAQRQPHHPLTDGTGLSKAVEHRLHEMMLAMLTKLENG